MYLGLFCNMLKEGQARNRYGLRVKGLFMGAHAGPDLWQDYVSLAWIWDEYHLSKWNEEMCKRKE